MSAKIAPPQLTAAKGTQHLIPLHDGVIHVQEYGSTAKPLLVALHGWADTLERSPIFIETLAESFHLFTIMMPGYGKSSENKRAHSLLFLAHLVSEVVEHFGWKNFDFLGYSLGTEVVSTYLSNHTEFQGKVVLLGTPLAPVAAPVWMRLLRIELVAETLRVFPFLRNLFLLGAKRAVKGLSTGEKRSLSRLKVRDATPNGIYDTLRASFETFPHPEKLTMPVIYLYGEEDVLVPKSVPAPHKLEILEGCGHLPQYEVPEKLGREVARLLKKNLSSQ